MTLSKWMSWEGGVDLIGASASNLSAPNVIVHVARVVHTPVGSAPSGMILIPNFDEPEAPPQLMGFISADLEVAAYFGPNVFAGTPFEHAPVLNASITINTEDDASAKVVVGDMVIETQFSELSTPYMVHREPQFLPFYQQGLEQKAGKVMLKVNGKEYPVFVPEVSMTGGPGAVLAATGMYAR